MPRWQSHGVVAGPRAGRRLLGTLEGVEVRVHYYESKDLARFGEVGKFRPELAEKFL